VNVGVNGKKIKQTTDPDEELTFILPLLVLLLLMPIIPSLALWTVSEKILSLRSLKNPDPFRSLRNSSGYSNSRKKSKPVICSYICSQR